MATTPNSPGKSSTKQEPSLNGKGGDVVPDPATRSQGGVWLWALSAAVVVVLGALGITWWLNAQPEEKPQFLKKGPPPPGFVDLGLMKRDLADGSLIQVQIVIRTPNKEAAEKIQHYLPKLRLAAVNTVGAQVGSDLITFEGKKGLRDVLLEEFKKEVDPDRAELLQGVSYTQFLMSN
jgi:flagellar basal body-associated protein FliL